MSVPTRPRAPWHSPATRRLALLRVGLPTLLACVFAMGSAVATTPVAAARGAAALVESTARGALSAFADHHGPHDGDRRADVR